ncbi:hypothetical protein AVEN_146871-1 [Araneus ventricosus]|uniref:Uncharacterized protein n=1 Tax=Araneus ventricosus TaxID=182803 RepID=A0A4Y2Q7D2_ARAVE|nr:hypothetical protein AVEN_146871-1 [Araneus ventricosus]
MRPPLGTVWPTALPANLGINHINTQDELHQKQWQHREANGPKDNNYLLRVDFLLAKGKSIVETIADKGLVRAAIAYRGSQVQSSISLNKRGSVHNNSNLGEEIWRGRSELRCHPPRHLTVVRSKVALELHQNGTLIQN